MSEELVNLKKVISKLQKVVESNIIRISKLEKENHALKNIFSYGAHFLSAVSTFGGISPNITPNKSFTNYNNLSDDNKDAPHEIWVVNNNNNNNNNKNNKQKNIKKKQKNKRYQQPAKMLKSESIVYKGGSSKENTPEAKQDSIQEQKGDDDDDGDQENPLNWKFQTHKVLRINNKGDVYVSRKSGTDPGVIQFGEFFDIKNHFNYKKISLTIDPSDCYLPGIVGFGMITDRFNDFVGTLSRLTTEYYVFITGNGKYFNNNIDNTTYFYDINKNGYQNRRDLRKQYPKGLFDRPAQVNGYNVAQKIKMEIEFNDKPILKIWNDTKKLEGISDDDNHILTIGLPTNEKTKIAFAMYVAGSKTMKDSPKLKIIKQVCFE